VQGLGKTVQVIALLAYLVEAQSISGPFLIVCPSSVLPNWEAELRAWAPRMRTLLYQGSVTERKALLAKHVRPSCLLR
jgi:SNF2 family DNA or RNA helicase